MTHFDPLSASPLQLLGLAGAATYIFNYCCLTFRLISSESVVYFLTNLLAASLVLISLGHAFNAASLVIQVFFIAVSLFGILSRVRRVRGGLSARPTRLHPIGYGPVR